MQQNNNVTEMTYGLLKKDKISVQRSETSKTQHHNNDKLLKFVEGKEYKTNPAALRFLASVLIEGKVVPEVVGMPVPDTDTEYQGQVVKRREYTIEANRRLIANLSKKAAVLGIFKEDAPISKEVEKRIENFLLRNGLPDLMEHAGAQYDNVKEYLKVVTHEKMADFINMQDKDARKPATEYLAYLAVREETTKPIIKNNDMLKKFEDDAERLEITLNDRISENKQKILKDFFSKRNKAPEVKNIHTLEATFNSVKKSLGIKDPVISQETWFK